MGIRLTTGAILRNYKSNLGTALSNRTQAMYRVMTGRSFATAAENPAAAARASQLKRKYMKNQDYLSMVDDVQSRQDSQEDALYQVNKIATQITADYSLQALNATNQSPDVRATFASALRQFQQSMVLSMNSSFEGKYIMAGSDTKNPPFELKDDGTLTYRGLDVNDPANTAKLEKMAKDDKLFIDLGFGLSYDTADKVVPSSAFNTSLPGIRAIGYGLDAEGDSKNLITLAGKMADLLDADTFDSDAYSALLDKFKKSSDNVLSEITQLGVNTEFLSTTKDRLENNDLSFQTQLQAVEGVDMAGAITDYSWAQYAYNASLKVGTSILSPSFIDFMS